MSFYHIQQLDNGRPEWKKGDEFSIDSTNLNWFNQLLIRDLSDTRITENNEKVGLIKYINDYFFKNLNKTYSDTELNYKNSILENTVTELRDSLRQYIKWIQEDIFERIRKDKYPTLPSRKHCLWVCNQDQLKKWWTLFCQRDNRFKVVPRKILLLELDGYFHEADGTLIDSDTYNISDFESKAIKYWTGQLESDKEVELLFMGKVKVLNEFKNIDEINNNT